MMRRLLIPAVALACGLCTCALAACGGSTPAAPGKTTTLTLASLVDVASFDPARSDVGDYVQYLQPAYDTLIRIEPDGSLGRDLATSWTYSDSNRDLRLTLRRGVRFSDGSPFTAAAVVASLERFGKQNGPRASATASIASVTAQGAHTVLITLSQPDPALLYNLGLVAGMIVNPKVPGATLNADPAGTGPYVLDQAATTKGAVYTFTRNRYYFDPGAFPFDRIVIKPIANGTAGLDALRTGQVDGEEGSISEVSQAKAAGLTVSLTPGDWRGLFLQDRDGSKVPALGNVQVRQAINYAIDAQGILRSIDKGFGTRSTQIFYPGTQAYDPGLNAAYPYDPAKARALLRAAGYPRGFTLTMPDSAFAILGQYSAIVKQELGAVGITVKYLPTTTAEGVTPYLSGQFPAYVFSWGASNPWLDASLLVAKDGGWNIYHAATPAITTLLGQIPALQGSAQNAAFRRLSADLVQQAWFDPWYVVDNVYFSSKSVKVTPQAEQAVPSIYNYRPAT